MKIRYTPFSERMVIDQPVKGMDFANDMIQTYFMMSLRYRECYYTQRPQGNTVYFMNYPEASLLFYFAAGMRSYRVNGFRIEKEERRKAWIYMLPLIQSLRAYDFGREEGTKQLEEDFLDHMLDMEEVLSGTLVPFHFILSPLPTECFPVCQEVRLFNRCAVEHAEKNYLLVTKNDIRQAEMPTAVYNKLSEIFWVPPDNRHKGWMFEYYTGIMENEGRKRKNYRVIHRPTDLPDKDGRCTYGQLSKEVMALLDENG